MKTSQKRQKLDENDNFQKSSSPLYENEEESKLEKIHLKIQELLENPKDKYQFLKAVEEVLKGLLFKKFGKHVFNLFIFSIETLDECLEICSFKHQKQIKSYLITGKVLVALLNVIEVKFGQEKVKYLLRFVNKNYESILFILAEHGDFEELLEFLRFGASIDIEFTKDLIMFTNNDQRNVLHNVCEFGEMGSTREFLDFLLTTFNDDLFIRELLRARAYSEPKNDVFFQKPKIILKYSPLRLKVFSRTKGMQQIYKSRLSSIFLSFIRGNNLFSVNGKGIIKYF